MFITTSSTPDHDDANQSGDAVAAAAAAAADKNQPAPDVDALALEAFGKGVEEGSAAHEPGKPPAAPVAAATDDGVDDDGEEIPAPDGKPAAKPPAAKPGEPAAKAGEPPAAAAAVPDPEVEQEITGFGLKPKAAERFRELTSYRKDNEPLIAAAKELGIESVEHIEQLRTVAEEGVAFREVMQQSQASQDQFARAFSYLGAVNSKDPVVMRQAFDAMFEEQKWLAEQLGLPVYGLDGKIVGDPLSVDPVMLKRVTDGEVPRDVALQAIAARRATELTTARSTASTATQQAADAKTAGLDAVKVAAQKLVTDEGLATFQAKQALLAPLVAAVQKNLPPNEWATEIDRLFRATKLPAAAAAPPPKDPLAPIRPNQRGSEGRFVAKPKDDFDAFDMGVAAANAGG